MYMPSDADVNLSVINHTGIKNCNEITPVSKSNGLNV